ncbi:MAG TPA: hypothetical protein VIA06_10905 [Candidatus Dormibacteraeota bacterium]|nr:hypothetical protein [Candidatus Dormibacteraeota bacterium]
MGAATLPAIIGVFVGGVYRAALAPSLLVLAVLLCGLAATSSGPERS